MYVLHALQLYIARESTILLQHEQLIFDISYPPFCTDIMYYSHTAGFHTAARKIRR
jgi:hypothetical protein